jgi:hypothetical protein
VHPPSDLSCSNGRFVDPEDSSLVSPEATVTISITSQNDAPAAVPINRTHGTNYSWDTSIFNHTSNSKMDFTLTAVDVDEDASHPRSHDPSFAPHPFARISRFPRGGQLFQLNPDGSLGESLDSTVTTVCSRTPQSDAHTSTRAPPLTRLRTPLAAQVPTTTSWVTEVVRYSSQYSRCRNCYVWSGKRHANRHHTQAIHPGGAS